MPSIIHNGVAFECHAQNCLARFDLKTKELLGFVIRDLGAVRVHRKTLYASTGIELDCLPGHSIVVPDLDDVYTRAYHAAFQNHLQRLIRVLDFHYNDQGWAIVRKHLIQTIPKDHALYNAWLSPERKTLLSKSFLRMRIARMDRFVSELFRTLSLIIHFRLQHVHASVPNLIIHRESNNNLPRRSDVAGPRHIRSLL